MASSKVDSMAAIRAIVVTCLLVEASGHGMLWWPPNRASMWRFGYNTPANYNDNQMFCGGKTVHWESNNGSCGECGDDFALDRPRAHENTGTYGTGVSVATYSSGESIDVSVKLTANHLGYFEFKLCPLSNTTDLETEECFSENLLTVAGNISTKYYLPDSSIGFSNFTVTLPETVSCELCVLQWTYTAGNSWGTCSNGTSGIGCGPQETFKTCSDITIY
uniref:Chitin-binding type-4 domain-containing protein n=1 Tax=Timema cristinae TaxID=61476 RepID=A0A7R9CMB0_TIMCR|nr:unnamed protein product [Timema cristinae]